jgi:hypothetical protein
MEVLQLSESSDSVVNEWIGNWRLARLSKDIGCAEGGFLGRLVDLGPAAILSGIFGSGILALFFRSQLERDAEVVQRIVDRMPKETKDAFEASYLAIIRGQYCTDWPHTARAQTLGITRDQYNWRVKAGKKFIAQRLPSH